MEVFLVMIGAGLALFALCLAGVAWATRGGQFDDLDTPAWRALDDAQPVRRPPAATAVATAPCSSSVPPQSDRA